LLVIAPSILAVAVFVYGLIIWTGYISTVKWDTLRPDYTPVGLGNYASIFANNRFLIDIRNTVVFTICFIAASGVRGSSGASSSSRWRSASS